MPATTSNATQRERDGIHFDKVPGTRAQAHGSVAKKTAQAKRETTLPVRFVPRFWEDSDTRFHSIRVIRKRYKLLKADTQADSYPRDMLCQRAAFLSVVLETMEVKACEGTSIDLGVYTQSVNTLSGLLLRLGLEKLLKNVHDLQSYLEQKDPCKRRTPCPDRDALKYKNRSAHA